MRIKSEDYAALLAKGLRDVTNTRPVHPPLASGVSDPQPELPRVKKPLGRPQAKGGRPESTIVIITRCSTRSLDRDNLWGGVKATCDGLRYSGYISGDTEQDIELFVFQKKVPKAHIGTLIEIIRP